MTPAPCGITVVVPYLNRAHTLSRCLRSLVAQPFRPVQLILVDNGSTDSSAALCRAFAGQNDSEQFAVHLVAEPSPGAAAARNAGLAAARYPLITFFDSDDTLSPHYLTDLHHALVATGAEMAIAASGVRGCGLLPPRHSVRHSATPAGQALCGGIVTQGMGFRTDFVRRIGGWNAALRDWDDWELALRALLYSPRLARLPRRAYHRISTTGQRITNPSYAAASVRIQRALEAAVRAVESVDLPPAARRRAHYALALRAAIIAGRCRAEGDARAAGALLRLAFRLAGARHPRALRAVYRYTRCGGRGAWRLGLLLLRTEG